MKIVHYCAGLESWNGMANTALQFVAEERRAGNDSFLTDDPRFVVSGVEVVYIHGSWLPVLWNVAKRAKKIGAKLIIRPAGSYDPVRRAFHGWKKSLVSFWEHRMLRRADVLLATCPEEMEWIRAYEPEVRSVELTDLCRFFNLQAPLVRPLKGLRSKPLHVLYLGRRHPLKGIIFLEHAVEEVNAAYRASHLDQAEIDGIELKKVGTATGNELEKIWEWADILCLPTLSENFGRVVAEALEHGRRVITTDGAPAWRTYFEQHPDAGIYLKGYRDGTAATRVNLLATALNYEIRSNLNP